VVQCWCTADLDKRHVFILFWALSQAILLLCSYSVSTNGLLFQIYSGKCWYVRFVHSFKRGGQCVLDKQTDKCPIPYELGAVELPLVQGQHTLCGFDSRQFYPLSVVIMMLTLTFTLTLQNVKVCVITCRALRVNGKSKKYLDIKDGVCYGVDTHVTSTIHLNLPWLRVSPQGDRKYAVRILDTQQMELHSPDFIVPMNGRTPEQTHADIFHYLLSYLHPLPGHDRCGLCNLWVLNVQSCQFLEPLFTSNSFSEHIHFNIRDRVIKRSL
jgi:hypothetical protein